MASLDVLIRCANMPTWQRGCGISDFALDGGGPAATAIVAAAKLGVRAGWVGTAGTDEAADLKVRFLARHGVDVSRLVRRQGPENQVVVVYVEQTTGERVFCGLRKLGDNRLTPQELDRQYITSAQYLHLDGFQAEAALEAARWMRHAGRKVVLDGGTTGGQIGPHLRQLIPHVDVLICGSGFIPALTGRTDLAEAGRAALDLGPSVVVQTEGDDGSYTTTAEGHFHTPIFPVEVLDTTGAGDVFHGAYIVGLLRGWDVGRIATFASAVAAMKCTRLGGRAGIPTFDQAVEFCRRHGRAVE